MKIKEMFNLQNKEFLFLLAASAVFYFPIVYGQSLYADDVHRTHTGVAYWEIVGRYLATDIAKLFSLGSNLIVDAAPLTWLLSIFIVALSANLIYRKFLKINKPYALPLSMVFIANPFFIQNLLYRFDNLGMTLAMFFVVLSFSLPRTKLGYVISVLCLTISLNFYQAFINLYLGLLAIEILLLSIKRNESKLISKYFVSSIICFIIANTLYLLELNVFGYNSSRSEMLPISLLSFPIIWDNLLDVFHPFFSFWNKFSYYILMVIPFCCVFLFVELRRKNYQLIFWGVISIVLIYISGAGVMALLKTQFIRARVLTYFPIIMMAITIFLILSHQKFKFLIILPIFACLVFSYRVGNIHRLQTEFEKPIFALLAVDIYSTKKVDRFYNIGSVPISSYITNIREATPFHGYLSRSGWQTTGRAWEYVANNKIELEWTKEARKTQKKYEKLKNNEKLLLVKDSSPFYKIYKKDREGYIVWN